MIDNIRYPFKVWITSLLLGTLIIMQLGMVTNDDKIFSSMSPMIYLFSISIGGLFSLPCFMTFWICYHLLLHFNQSELMIRMYLALFSLLTCSLTLMLFTSSNLLSFWKQDNLISIGAYAVPLIVGVMFYKLDKQKAPICK